VPAKAQTIEGGTTTRDPAKPDPVAAGFASGAINVMIAYCSGAEQRRKAGPDLEVVAVPEAFATGPEYGMAIMSFDKPAVVALAFTILSPEGQAVLKCFGFAPVGLQANP
jgi:molybdate transport system substrate-binding protein